MHELSVAQSLIDILTEQLAAHPPAAVEVVHISVGRLSGVEPAALRSAFHVAAGGTIVQGAKLEIVDVPVRVWCSRCGAERDVKAVADLRCNACDEPSNDVRTGRELFVDHVQVRD